MNKILFQGLFLVALFFATLFALRMVDWMKLFRVEKMTATTEQKLGDLLWDLINQSDKEIKDENITKPVDSILTKICSANNIDRSEIKLHIISSGKINAFALPNKHLIVFEGLLEATDNEAEVAGVIGHEVGHMEQNHVMKKLIKEVGLTVLISMTSGNGGGEIIKETLKLLSSTAYDRSLEKEADIKSVDYLLNAHINPEPFANFLFKLADDESKVEKNLSWIKTHPDSRERAEYIIEYSKDKVRTFKPILTQATWDTFKKSL